MAAEEKENMDTLPVGKVEENAPNMELPVPNREVTLDSSPKPVSYTHLDVYKRQLLICFSLTRRLARSES